jgi:eukaryotic-like serine/threonine-protein kinase
MQGEVGGTPTYIATEQVTHYREVKPSADQYSAAATLYKLLTDQYARDLPKDVGAQLALIVTTDPLPITNRRPEIPAKLTGGDPQALSREPEARYPDVLTFRTELKRFA